MDRVILVATVLSFALWVTAHVATVFGLATRTPRWRALVALLVLPLAPYWAARERMRARAVVWILAALGYTAAGVLCWR